MFHFIKRQIFNLRVWWFRKNYEPTFTVNDRLEALRNMEYDVHAGNRREVIMFHSLFSDELANLRRQRYRKINAKPSRN